jgi:hypothetical protein
LFIFQSHYFLPYLAEKPSQARDYANALGIKKKHKEYIEIKDSEIISNAIVTWGAYKVNFQFSNYLLALYNPLVILTLLSDHTPM